MKVFVNESGYTVYRMEGITDLALIPDDVWERNGGWQMFEIGIASLRMIVASGEAREVEHGVRNPFPEALPKHIDLVDDEGLSVSHTVEGTEESLLKISIKKND